MRKVRTFLSSEKHVDLFFKQFNISRYRILAISFICWIVSWLVYVGLLFLFTKKPRLSAG
jgi:hypothetical protein